MNSANMRINAQTLKMNTRLNEYAMNHESHMLLAGQVNSNNMSQNNATAAYPSAPTASQSALPPPPPSLNGKASTS